MTDTLKVIQLSYGDPENPNKEIICRDRILQWMNEKDLNILGALYSYLMRSNYSQRIEPPLEFKHYKIFFLNYYRRCLIEDNLSDDPEVYLMSKYEAGWDMANWILSLQNEHSIKGKELNNAMLDIKRLLGELYTFGSIELQNCLITAVLEHIFTNKKIANFFKDWESDNALREAYQSSIMYSKKLIQKK